jgi:hypothetical protein
MLESNVEIYVIYMQCEFIPCINLLSSVFMMLCNGFLYTCIIMQINRQWMYGNRLWRVHYELAGFPPCG